MCEVLFILVVLIMQTEAFTVMFFFIIHIFSSVGTIADLYTSQYTIIQKP